MKHLAAILLLSALAGCSDGAPGGGGGGLPAGTYAGVGRDRLCVDASGARFGLVAYGHGDSNCSAQGRINGDASGLSLSLVPLGEQEGGCIIPVRRVGNTISVGKAPAACAYYCGPGSSLGAKSFTFDPKTSPAVDFAGEPLC